MEFNGLPQLIKSKESRCTSPFIDIGLVTVFSVLYTFKTFLYFYLSILITGSPLIPVRMHQIEIFYISVPNLGKICLLKKQLFR